MGVVERFRNWWNRDINPLNVDQWAWYFNLYNEFPLAGLTQSLKGDREEIGSDFASLVDMGYRTNGVIFACELARIMLFSEARFRWRQVRFTGPGDLFGNEDLDVLNTPWPGGTTGDLLVRALLDADFAGNHFATIRDGRVVRMRPDWVTIVMGSRSGVDYGLDTEVIAYLYQPGGKAGGQDPEVLGPDEVAHFAPIPDPLSMYRGMSWLTPIIMELGSDRAATAHKRKFFEQGATPNLIVKLDPSVGKDLFEFWVEKIRSQSEGVQNAYKTMVLGGGADPVVVGKDFQQIEFKATQGAGETRIASASGMHPVIVGLSEGLQGSSLNAGNFNAARRIVADRTLRPLWRNVSGSYTKLVRVPPRAELWYDDTDIPFLQEDLKDRAEVQQMQAQALRQLIEAGFEPDSAVSAIAAGDMARLTHTGLTSVQLQPPMPQGLPQPARTRKVERDDDGRIVRIVEEPAALPAVSLNGGR